VLEEAATAKTFDQPQFAVGYALVAIPARWALERRDWKAAADLQLPAAQLPWDRFSYAHALTYFAQALGAARTGQLDRSRAALAKLQEVQTALAKAPVPGPYDWAANVESERLAAAAWLAYAESNKDEALRMARAAAELDEKTGKHPVTPGAPLPGRELLGDMLLETGKPAEALIEYEASLREAPNRFNGLYGAARAAELSKQSAHARELYGRLAAQCVARSDRKELAEARRYLEEKQVGGGAR
jgi:tetratricopeptide (TPR) repeat protein